MYYQKTGNIGSELLWFLFETSTCKVSLSEVHAMCHLRQNKEFVVNKREQAIWVLKELKKQFILSVLAKDFNKVTSKLPLSLHQAVTCYSMFGHQSFHKYLCIFQKEITLYLKMPTKCVMYQQKTQFVRSFSYFLNV